jgi:HEAT repeat protein
MGHTKKIKLRTLKTNVQGLLSQADFEKATARLMEIPARQGVNPLISLLCSTDDLLRWRAAAALGKVVGKLAQSDMESARVVMRRLMWQMNEESGGIGWGVPEAMAEIMAGHKGLATEYASILVSYIREGHNFLEYDPLRRGAVWGVGRVAQTAPDLVQWAIPALSASLGSDDPAIRGLAAWAVGWSGYTGTETDLKGLVDDQQEVLVFENGELEQKTVGLLASEALTRLGDKSSAISGTVLAPIKLKGENKR